MIRSPKDKGMAMKSAKKAEVPTPRITLKFLAQRLGLSRTTISIVLNNAPQASVIPQQTRDRILSAAKEFNYKPSFLGRSLNYGRTYLIGVISPDLSEGYTAGLLGGIEHALLDSEYQFFVASHHWSEQRALRTAQMFAERSVEGIILINTPFIPEVGLPMVQIGHHDDKLSGPSLVVDNGAGILAAMTHLHELGHRRFALIRGHQDSADSDDRWNAVLSAAQKLSVVIDPSLVVQLERMDMLALASIEEGARCAERLMPRRGEFTALMAFNDMSAIGATNRLVAAGWRIPEELSVVGFDDILDSRITRPALTTVRQPLGKMGEMAATEMIRCITGTPHKRTIMLIPELVVRESTGPAAPQSR